MTLSERINETKSMKHGVLIVHFGACAKSYKTSKVSREMNENIQIVMMQDKLFRCKPKRMNLKFKRTRILQEESQMFSNNNNDTTSQEICDRLSPLPSEIFSAKMSSLPRRANVVLHATSANPYLVVFNSDNKYATPIAYLKLKQFNVTTESDYTFKLCRKRTAEDLGTDNGLSSVTFETLSEKSKNEWLETLSPLCSNKATTWESPIHHKNGIVHSLPSLLEEDEESDSSRTLNSLKSPVRKISRIARKNSFGNLKNATAKNC